jgi:hypothetical protein
MPPNSRRLDFLKSTDRPGARPLRQHDHVVAIALNRVLIARLNNEWCVVSRLLLKATVAVIPRSGELHLPSEEVMVVSVVRNLDGTLLKVRWRAGGECVVFPEELEEIPQGR